MKIAVLDIGGTLIKSALFENGILTSFAEARTMAAEGGPAVIGRAECILREFDRFDAIGISTAGQIDTAEGSVFYANPNIPDYAGMQIKKIFEKEFSVPAVVENDVNAAAIGELYHGAARGQKDFLCLTYGTGIGGAIVINREIYHGKNWSGGCFGGIVIHPDKIRKEEELSGCYETFASVSSLVRTAMQVDKKYIDGKKVFEAFECPQIREIIDSWINEIIYGLITLIHVFDPPLIVLGGGIMSVPYVVNEINRKIFSILEKNFQNVKIVKAQLGNKAGLMGAAILAAQNSGYGSQI